MRWFHHMNIFAKVLRRKIAKNMPWILLNKNAFLKKVAQTSSCDPWYWSDSIFRFYVDFLRHHKWEYFQYRMGHYSKISMSAISRLLTLFLHKQIKMWDQQTWGTDPSFLDLSLPTVNLCSRLLDLGQRVQGLKWHFLPSSYFPLPRIQIYSHCSTNQTINLFCKK